MASTLAPNTRRTNGTTDRGGADPKAMTAVTSNRNASFTAPGLSAEDGATVIEILQRRLEGLIDLGLTLKHIHWNVVGPSFIGVHMMLDPQYAGVQAMVDTTAERIATLGGVPNGLPGCIVANRSWDDYDLGRADSQAHLGALDLVYRALIESHRDAIDATEEPDPVTQDMLIGQTAELEQYHWFVRSHLEDYAGGLSNAGATTEIGAAQSSMRKATAKGRGRTGVGKAAAHRPVTKRTARPSAASAARATSTRSKG
jgi:starvation-inducible DNA-binding protein